MTTALAANTKVQVVGVRHHSPACARLVESVLRESRPAAILIEGPADFNERISELTLEHEAPLAIFSYFQSEESTRSSWSPFCDYSPEWVALKVGKELGAEVMFMDLPAWTRPFRGVSNRYADRGADLDYVGALCERLNVDGMDALWDHLFEQPQSVADLSRRLDSYFEAIRGCESTPDRDLERETFMASNLAWAAAKWDSVVAVCGGFHKPYLESAWPSASAVKPVVPQPEAGARYGSFLVPYSFRRLDSFAGYASGMPSPFYYQSVWEHGPVRAAEVMAAQVARRLRDRKQVVSAADLIAAHTMTEGLMRLRGHPSAARVDLLDGFASALVKEAIEIPLPWNHRGVLPQGTHPMLVELVATFSGERSGKLDPRTPLPPLVEDVRVLLQELDLLPSRPARKVTAVADSPRSHVLHRLQLLSIPGFVLKGHAQDTETWSLTALPEFDSALIEAGAWGATLEQATQAMLEEMIAGAEGELDKVASLLGRAYQAGLGLLSDGLLLVLEMQVQIESQFTRLGKALGIILGLYRRHKDPRMGGLLEVLCERGLWLFECLQGQEMPADPAMITGVVALRNTYRVTEGLALDFNAAASVMRRRSTDGDAPPAVRGAALGFLWSTGSEEADLLAEQSTGVIQASSRPEEMGDFLAGLFGLAREEVAQVSGLMEAVDTVVCGFDDHDFLIACPSLRLAFSYFPPREREKIARVVLGLHGGDPVEAWSMIRLEVAPNVLADNHQLEKLVSEQLHRFGLSR